MSAPLRVLGRLLKAGTLLSTLGFAACVVLQIAARLLLPTAPSWTEEAARLCFVLAVGCAAGLALRGGGYVRFDFLYGRLPAPWQRRVGRLNAAATVLLFGVFAVEAVRFAAMGLAERSPALRLPMAVAFAAMVVLGGGVLAYALAWARRAFARPRVLPPGDAEPPPR